MTSSKFVESLRITAQARVDHLKARLGMGVIGAFFLWQHLGFTTAAIFIAGVFASQALDHRLWAPMRSGGAFTSAQHKRACLASFQATAVYCFLPAMLWLYGDNGARIFAMMWILGASLHVVLNMHQERLTLIYAASPHFIALFGLPLASLIFDLAPGRASSITVLLGAILYVGHLFAIVPSTRKMTTDLSESRLEALEKQKEAEVANISKSEFLANMSHEIRTPMNGVLGMAELMRQTNLDEKQKVFANTIYTFGSALLTIINDILDFSKIEAGKVDLDLAPFNLEQAVEDVAALLGVGAREKELELLVRIPPNLPSMLVGDVGRLRQVLTNIVGNAIKFTAEGSVLINVEGEYIGDTAALKISVADSGIGIPSDKLDKIFDAFTQAEGATTREFGGTGLGLTISRNLIAAMGGDIQVASTVGKGSTFTIAVTLPTAESAAQQGALALNKAPVLIVDDNPISGDILAEQISSIDGQPALVESGRQALDLLRQQAKTGEAFKLAIIDSHMPEMDGLALTQHIRNDASIGDIEIIVLSSVDGENLKRAFQDLNVREFATKPVPAVRFKNYVRDALNKRDVEKGVSDATAKSQDVADEKTPICGRRLKVLVADDNQVNQIVIESMLDKAVYDVSFADDGQAAYDAYRLGEFDMILMDISMPNMDGVEATKAIKSYEQEHGLSATPVIALTAHAMSGSKEKYLEQGLDDYLSKPVKMAELVDALMRWQPSASNAAELKQPEPKKSIGQALQPDRASIA